MYRNTYVEINVDNIRNNVKNIITKYNSYKYYIGVVKGNAYGHGLKVAKWMIESGINYLATATLDEALEIRNKIDKEIPILILQPVDLEYIEICSNNDLTITISNYEYYKKLKELNISKLKVHIKVDTGMNRLGINNKDEIKNIYNELVNNNNIILEGIYTHLATVGIVDNRFDMQVEKFKYLTSDIDLNNIPIVHLYSSNSLVIHPKLEFANGVRLGIILYGISPKNINNKGIKNHLRKLKRNYKRKKMKLSPINNDFSIDVKSAISLCSYVSEIKNVDSNEYIGYGNKYLTNENCKIAIIPVGYMDGLSLNNTGRMVSINNRKYPIVGSINMGMITVKIDSYVKLDDKVIVINDIRSISSYVGTTPHQLITSISPLLKRVYIDKNGNIEEEL